LGETQMSKLRAILLVGLIAVCGTMVACSGFPGGCGCDTPCNPCGAGPSN